MVEKYDLQILYNYINIKVPAENHKGDFRYFDTAYNFNYTNRL